MNAERRSGGLPPGYPAQYEQKVRLGDGRRVLIRPILPSDAPELAEAIRTADPDTLRRRFLGGPPRMSAALLEHLTVVDYVQRLERSIRRRASRFIRHPAPEPSLL
jgi:hypothetical protein